MPYEYSALNFIWRLHLQSQILRKRTRISTVQWVSYHHFCCSHMVRLGTEKKAKTERERLTAKQWTFRTILAVKHKQCQDRERDSQQNSGRICPWHSPRQPQKLQEEEQKTRIQCHPKGSRQFQWLAKGPRAQATAKAPQSSGQNQASWFYNCKRKPNQITRTKANMNKSNYVYIPCHTIVSVQEMGNPKTNDHSWITDHSNSQGDWTNYRSCVHKRILATQTHKP